MTSRRHQLGKLEQVKNGFRLAGMILVGFAISCVVLAGFASLLGVEQGKIGKITGLLFIFAGAIGLYVTSNRWKNIIAGFFGIWGVFNSVGVLISGQSHGFPHHPVPRSDAAWMFLFCVLLTALFWPTERFCKPANTLTRLLLVAGLLILASAAFSQSAQFVEVTVAMSLFLMARVRHELQHSKTLHMNP